MLGHLTKNMWIRVESWKFKIDKSLILKWLSFPRSLCAGETLLKEKYFKKFQIEKNPKEQKYNRNLDNKKIKYRLIQLVVKSETWKIQQIDKNFV
jgi:hypothetical protein